MILVGIVLLLAGIALLAAMNIGGTSTMLTSTGTEIGASLGIVGLIIVAGIVLRAMGNK